MTVRAFETTTDAFLGGRLSLKQPRDGYRAGSDSIFLAASCDAKPGERVLELGCGVGAALLSVGLRANPELWGVELVPDIAELARDNAAENGLSARIFTGDIAALPAEVTAERFDHVLMNPPYFGSGTAAQNDYRDTARREVTPLGLWVETGLRRVAPGGVLTLIHTAERLGEILTLLNPYAVSVEIKPLAARVGRPAKRVIVRAQRGGGGVTTLHNPLILHASARHIEGQSDFSAEADAILRQGTRLEF